MYDGNAHTARGYSVRAESQLYKPETGISFSGNATATRTDVGTTYMGLNAEMFSNTDSNFGTVIFEVTDGYVTIAEAPLYRLTVHYLADGTEFNSFTAHRPYGTGYNVTSPTRTGYTPDQASVTGVLTEDTDLYVNYTRQAVTLTVRFLTLDGDNLADPVELNLYLGDSYSVDVPGFEGYRALNPTNVEGTIGGQNLEVIRYYIPVTDELPTYAQIDDYTTPLDIGQVNRNSGETIE